MGFADLRIWPIFGVLHGLRVFYNFVFGFRFSSTMMAVLVQCILRFFGVLVKTPQSF